MNGNMPYTHRYEMTVIIDTVCIHDVYMIYIYVYVCMVNKEGAIWQGRGADLLD